MFVGKPIWWIGVAGDFRGVVFSRATRHTYNAFRPHGRGLDRVGEIEGPLWKSVRTSERGLCLHGERRRKDANQQRSEERCKLRSHASPSLGKTVDALGFQHGSGLGPGEKRDQGFGGLCLL